jgi:hypothetical protein
MVKRMGLERSPAGCVGVVQWKPRPSDKPMGEPSRPPALKYAPRFANVKFRRRFFRDLMSSRIDYADWSG